MSNYKVVVKYELHSMSSILRAIYGFKPLHVDEQEGKLVVWGEVDEEHVLDGKLAIFRDLEYRLFWTGQAFYTTLPYLGTVQRSNGLVEHVYMEGA